MFTRQLRSLVDLLPLSRRRIASSVKKIPISPGTGEKEPTKLDPGSSTVSQALSGAPNLPRVLRELNVRIPKSSKMPSRPKPPPETDFEEKFIKGGTGHGGQKINKTNSKVQLTHKATGIVITCQATRSREQNRKIARELLAEKLDVMANGVLSRKGIVSAAKQAKANRSERKRRKKYKDLAKEKEVPQTATLQVLDDTVVIQED